MREPLSRSQSVTGAQVQAGAFQALAGSASTTKLAQLLETLVRVSRLVERDQRKTGACELVHHRRRSNEMAASGAHARQASVNEPSGGRLFSGFWVES